MKTIKDLNARQARAIALWTARTEYGYCYSRPAGRHCYPPGKFQCEPFEVTYFWDATMNGFPGDLLMHEGADEADGEIFELSEHEREAFEVEPGRTHAVLWYSSQGFVSLEYVTDDRAADLLAEYSGECE